MVRMQAVELMYNTSVFLCVLRCVSGSRSLVDFEQVSTGNIIQGKRKDLWNNTEL